MKLWRGGRKYATGGGVFIAAAVLFVIARRSAGFWGIDDAGITYGHAFELADHGSLAPYVEGMPVESFSNPLVFFVTAALRWLGHFDPVVTHHRIEMLLFAAMTALVWSLLRRIANEAVAVAGALAFALIELATPATWLWYGSGLENVWVSAGVVALLWLAVRTALGTPLRAGWGVLGALVALTRPEAPVYVAAFYAALVLARPPELRWATHLRRAAAALAVTSVLYALFLVWRHTVYGDWLPNTYYAKLGGGLHLFANLRGEIFGNILRYAHSAWFASTALLLLAVPRLTRIGRVTTIMVIASLALPLTAGTDFFMGENRFATPFLAVAHASFAVLAAWILTLPATWRQTAALAAVLALPSIVIVDRLRRAPLYLDSVTTARVAELQGGERWEQQVRLGLPYAVTMLPDIGGAILVGAIQLIDDAYLGNYQLAHIGRYYGGDGSVLRQLDQYQQEERRPDQLDPSTSIGFVDAAYVGTRYLRGTGHLLARRDLVELTEVPQGAQAVLGDDHVQIYVSPRTVTDAVPGALARYEVIVAWSGGPIDETLSLRATVQDGDGDAISLHPYQPGDHGIERRALLLGAPGTPGRTPVTFELLRANDVVTSAAAPALSVATDLTPFIADAAADPSPIDAAWRLAWLREQSIPRFGMTHFHLIERVLLDDDRKHSSRAGRNVMKLRWQARLAAFESLPVAFREAEQAISRRVVATCGAGSERVVCLGRAVDTLRRLGYLGVIAHDPTLAAELAHARATRADLGDRDRYRVLVALTLADPADLTLERELLESRRRLATYPPLP